MIDWVLFGVMGAVLMAEVVDALALHGLVRRCAGIQPRSVADVRLVRWYAEGFDHSRLLTAWLRSGCLALTVLCVTCAAHPALVVASLLLAIGAHCESSFSAALRRRYVRAGRR